MGLLTFYRIIKLTMNITGGVLHERHDERDVWLGR